MKIIRNMNIKNSFCPIFLSLFATTSLLHGIWPFDKNPAECFEAYNEHMKEHGKGQYAIEVSAQQTVTIKGLVEANKQQSANMKMALQSHQSTLKDLSDAFAKNAAGLEKNAQATTNGAHQVTEAVDKSTAAQVEINKTLQKINAGAQAVGAVTGGIYIVKSVKDGVEWVQEYRNPDPEKQARKEEETEAAITRTEILKTRKKLHSCFAAHRRESRDLNGLPYSCDDAYHAFAAVAGYENAEHIAQAFRHANPIHNSQA